MLPTIAVPTLVLHRAGDRMVPIDAARVHRRSGIPGAKFVELPGDDHLPASATRTRSSTRSRSSSPGTRTEREPDRMLATVMFTDIVDSTKRAAELGDRRWRALIERHDQLMRRELERHRGRAVKTMGDGFLATFDGPARGDPLRDVRARRGARARASRSAPACTPARSR